MCNFRREVFLLCVVFSVGNISPVRIYENVIMADMGKILITKLHNKLLALLIQNQQILSIQAQKEDDHAIGNIYVGRVQNISVNIGAAFVDLGGCLTFLPLAEAKYAFVTNRKPDGTLKIGDEVLVQLVKEPMKTKLAGVTARISRAGTYVVVNLPMPDSDKMRRASASGMADPEHRIQVSSKLSRKQQSRFKSMEALREIADTCPLIVRTNAGELEEEQPLIEEARRLCDELLHIVSVADKRTCYSCLYRSMPAYAEFVQNAYRTEYDEIVTDIPEVYETLRSLMPELHSPGTQGGIALRLYEDDRLPLYKLYSLETRVKELLDKKVWLKSGGYLIIEPTEALISIDVNTGKCEKGRQQEETFLRINLEAARMIAIQLRARNLSGMILVDFINMKKKEHEAELIEAMRSFLKKDPVQTNVVDMTGLGLLELTRKKVNSSFEEQMRQS